MASPDYDVQFGDPNHKRRLLHIDPVLPTVLLNDRIESIPAKKMIENGSYLSERKVLQKEKCKHLIRM